MRSPQPDGALTPGTGSTGIPVARHAETSSTPGSETPGVPASVTSSNRSALLETRNQLRYAATNVVLVEAERWSRYAVMSEQPSRAAGVFRSNQIDGSKHPQRPQRDVLQVADGRGDHEQRAGHRDGRKVIVPLTG